MLKNTMKSFVFLMMTISMFVVLFTGCETKVNEDYAEDDVSDYHNFAPYNRHADYMANTGFNFDSCTDCHGDDLHGQASGTAGSIERSCFKCHKSDNHIVLFEKGYEHTDYLKSNNYPLDECYNCHSMTSASTGVDFGGSCSSSACHNQDNGGPEACNVCHGNFTGDASNQINWAPPGDLEGNISTSEPGVGAHRTHLTASSGWFAPVACNACHEVPSAWNDAGHLDTDGSGAEVIFADSDMNYDPSTNTCSSVYCHGTDNTPIWTEVDGTWNSCGSCHGLPPANHSPDFTDCSRCHGAVIDANGNIIDPSLHGNGYPDVQL